MRLTTPQLRALRMIAQETEDGPFSAGVIEISRLPGRMVDAYRVACSLIDKGLVTRKGHAGEYLYITKAGRVALAEQSSKDTA